MYNTNLKGNQNPTYKLSKNYNNTLGNICINFMSSLGYELMEWQKNFINDSLAIDEDGEFINMNIGLSVPRQNGKTLCIISLLIFFLVIYPEYAGKERFNLLYSSHQVKTNMETFNDMLKFFDDQARFPDLYSLTHWDSNNSRSTGISRANGKESITCKGKKDGKYYETKVGFVARSKNAARGVSVNIIALDEAQEITEEQMSALLPTISASQTKQQLYGLGTPTYIGCAGTAFSDMRKRCYKNEPDGVVWYEWSINKIEDIDNEEKGALTNPSYGYLINGEYIKTAELMGMSEDGFARERLGYWASEVEMKDYPIDKDKWEECINKKPDKDGIKCYGVKFDLTNTHCALTICVKNADNFHIELIDVYDCKGGLNAITDTLTKLKGKAAQIIIDGKGTSYDLAQRVIDNKVPKRAIIVAKTGDISDACQMLANAVQSNEITHGDQEQLNDSATQCTRRVIGNKGAWGFEDNGTGFGFLIESAALAYKAARETKRNPQRQGKVW